MSDMITAYWVSNEDFPMYRHTYRRSRVLRALTEPQGAEMGAVGFTLLSGSS